MQQTTTHNNLSEGLRAALVAHAHEADDGLADAVERVAEVLDERRLGGPGDAAKLADELEKSDAPSREAQEAYLASVRAA